MRAKLFHAKATFTHLIRSAGQVAAIAFFMASTASA